VPISAAEEDAIDAVSVAVASDGGGRVGGGARGRGGSPAPRGSGASEATISVEEAGRGIRPGGAYLADNTIVSCLLAVGGAHLEVRATNSGPSPGWICCAPAHLSTCVAVCQFKYSSPDKIK